MVLRIAGPVAIGVWKTAMSIYPLGSLANLGSSTGFSVLGPVLDGQRNQRESRELGQAAGNVSLVSGVAAGAAVFALSWLAPNPELAFALRMVAGVLALAQPMHFLRELASATRRFGVLASSNILSGVVDTLAYIGLAYLFGLTGLGIAAAVSTAVPALFILWATGFRFSRSMRLAPARQLVKAGLPAQSAGVLFQMTRRLDLLVLSVFCDPVLVGCYGVGLLIMDFAVMLADTGISKVVSPRVLTEFGRSGASPATADIFESALRLIFYLGPPLIASAALVIPVFVSTLLPEYRPGIKAAELVVWTQLFLCVHACLGGYLAATGRIGAQVKLLVAVLVGGLALQILSASAGFGLEGAALATLLTVAAAAATEIWLAEQTLGRRLPEFAKSLTALYWPSFYCFLVTIAAGQCLPAGTALSPTIVAQLAIVWAAYAPVLLQKERQFGLIRGVIGALPEGGAEAAPVEVTS